MKTLLKHNFSSFRSSLKSAIETLWLCYSTRTPPCSSHLFALFALCLSISAITTAFLFHWLTGLLKYDIQTATVAAGIYATSVLTFSFLIHPFRCALTLIFPTLGTKQGRKLLLSTSVMILILYVLPNMAANIATLTHVVKCASEKLSQSLLSSSGLINTIKDNIVKTAEDSINTEANLVQKLQNFDHTTNINVSEVKETLHFFSKQVQEDFSEVKSQVNGVKLLVSRIFAAFFVLYLFMESVVYLRSYLSSVRFDNVYITGGLREKAALKGISVKAKDLKNGVNSTSLRMTKEELCRCLLPALVITSYLLMTVLLVLLDYLLFYVVKSGSSWISDIPSTNISLSVQFKVGSEMHICQIVGSNCPIEWFNLNRSYTALIQTPSACEAHPSELNPSVVTALVFLYLLSYTLLLLEVYAQRLRRKVAASFFKRQEDKRIEFLIEKIQAKHKKIQNKVLF